MFKRKIQVLGLVFLPLFFCACFSIHVVRDIDNPRSYLKRAQNEIYRIHKRYPKRRRRAHWIHILVYMRDSSHLVRVSAPLWIVNWAVDFGLRTARRNGAFDEIEERYDVDWRALRDLGQIGPGLLVEVVSEKDQVLIWLK